METKEPQNEIWTTVERPGYFGEDKDLKIAEWNEIYGEGNWRISHIAADGTELTYEDIIRVYTDGYKEYFNNNPEDLDYLTKHFSYAYDLDMITKAEAYDPYAQYNKPGMINQFHHVALNIAVEELGYEFQGEEPVQIRYRKGVPAIIRRLSPGKIPCTVPELIPEVSFEKPWWKKDSIEDFYQSTKVLQIKT